jgi:hypothetical protein
VNEAFGDLVGWFGGLSRGAKVRLVLFTMLLAWLIFIVAPAVVIQTLAADDVTNLQGAIAFVKTATPVAVDTALPTDAVAASLAESVAPEVGPQVESAPPAAAAPVESAPAVEASVPPAEPVAAAGSEAAGPTLTPTPYVIVVTNTPAPATDTPIPPTDTPVPPTATSAPFRQVSSAAQPQPTPTAAEPARNLDHRLPALGVAVQPAGVRPGQSYWRLVAARWENESEAGGGHSIFINVLDENGGRIINQPVEIRWVGGGLTVPTEDKPLNEYSANFPMYNTLGSYSVSVAGLPSDVIVGMGLGTAEQPDFKVHTNFFLTFQRVTR